MLAQGLIVRRTQRAFPSGRGRPAFGYAITRKGEGLFPARGFGFVLRVLGSLARSEPNVVEDAISRELQPLVEEARNRLRGSGSLPERLQELQQLFEEWGYITNIAATAVHAGGLEQAHCPFSPIARACPQVCALESQLLSAAFRGFDVRKVDSRSSGSRTCRWSVRKVRSVDSDAGSAASLATRSA